MTEKFGLATTRSLGMYELDHTQTIFTELILRAHELLVQILLSILEKLHMMR